jgi:hypothetical protein
VSVAPQKIAPANFAQLQFERVSCGQHERCKIRRVLPLSEGCANESSDPRSQRDCAPQWKVERAVKGDQLTPKTNEKLQRR